MEEMVNMLQSSVSSWQAPSWSITLSTAAAIWFAFNILDSVLRNRRLRLPPSPPAYPVIGHMKTLGRLPHQGLARLSRSNGPIFRVRLGSIKCVVISSPDFAREILKTQDHIFGSRPRVFSVERGYGVDAEIIWSPVGENLQKLRKVCTTELFTARRIEQFEGVRREEIFSSVQNILAEGAEGKLVQLPVRMTELAFNIITRIVSTSVTMMKTGAKTMLLAGSETTSNTVLWTLAELMRHPDIRQKVQMELDAVVGKDRLVTEADLVHLRYPKAVVKESFRLQPVAPLLIPRESLKATKVAGYDIPAKTRIFVNAYAIHRDPKVPNVWENPLKFDPERFINTSIDVRGQNFEVLPFGSGRRVCLGMNLGELMVELVLARLLHMLDFALPLGMNPLDVSVEEGPGVTAPMAKPLELRISPRLPSQVYVH